VTDGDNGRAVAFTESNGTDANTYVTRWTSAIPEEPVLARAGARPCGVSALCALSGTPDFCN